MPGSLACAGLSIAGTPTTLHADHSTLEGSSERAERVGLLFKLMITRSILEPSGNTYIYAVERHPGCGDLQARLQANGRRSGHHAGGNRRRMIHV